MKKRVQGVIFIIKGAAARWQADYRATVDERVLCGRAGRHMDPLRASATLTESLGRAREYPPAADGLRHFHLLQIKEPADVGARGGESASPDLRGLLGFLADGCAKLSTFISQIYGRRSRPKSHSERDKCTFMREKRGQFLPPPPRRP